MVGRSRTQARRDYDRDRGSARARGYDAAWERETRLFRLAHPFCRYCEVGAFGAPRVSATACVDHLYPHRGDRTLFWTRLWWVPSCEACHVGPKQAAERAGPTALDRLARLLDLPTRPRG